MKDDLGDLSCEHRGLLKASNTTKLDMLASQEKAHTLGMHSMKFNNSSYIVEYMNDSKQHSVNNNGIGYSVVKPPFNHNYTSNSENDHVTKFAFFYATGCWSSQLW